MNCSEFAENWNEALCDTLSAENKVDMAEHAAQCSECSIRWQALDELRSTLTTVLGTQTLDDKLDDRVVEQTYLDHFGTQLNLGSQAEMSTNLPKYLTLPVLVSFLLGGLAGFLISSSRTNNLAMVQQAAMSQMFGGRYGRGSGNDMLQLLFLSEFSGGSSGLSGGGGGLLAGSLPQVTSVIKTLFWIFALVWITRTRIWEMLFPLGVPGGILFARLMAVLFAIAGLARCGCSLALVYRIITGLDNSGTAMFEGDTGFLVRTSFLLDHGLSITFWVTVFVVLFTILNQGGLKLAKTRGVS